MSSTETAPHSVPPYSEDPSVEVRSHYLIVDGIRTHYLQAGSGPDLVLLHAGDFGACSEITWEYNIAALAAEYRVIAPDWLGYGGTDKVHDFGGFWDRRLRHMGRTLELLDIRRAAFLGSSMGATMLVGVAAHSENHDWPIAAMVLVSGGGFAPLNEHRQVLQDYDGTPEAMRGAIAAMMWTRHWAEDERYVERRVALANAPGAWEAVAAPRLKLPVAERGDSVFGQKDRTPYENVTVPTLVIAGADDRLREPGYAAEIGGRIAGSRVLEIPECGHMGQIEKAPEVNQATLEFLRQVYPAGSPSPS